MNLPGKNNYYFDDVTIDCENFRAQKNRQKVTLTPRAFDVLVFLLENGGRVVEKQELFDQIWKDTFVSNNALTKVIKEIRHALEDSADNPRYIETIPKRGYRFIGGLREKPVELVRETKEKSAKTVPEIVSIPDGKVSAAEENESDEETVRSLPDQKLLHQTSSARSSQFVFSKSLVIWSAVALISVSVLAAWISFRRKPIVNLSSPMRSTKVLPLNVDSRVGDSRAITSSSSIRSIAVLPFKPLNAASRDESLEMGMAEALITRLSNLKQMSVRPMSAVSNYTDLQQDAVKAGHEIGVETVLDGSIQKSDDRVRVTVRLIGVRSGSQLWSEQFDEKFTNIFKVQDSIAERITNSLTIHLTSREKEQLAKHYTDSPEAYQLYWRGQLLWHRRLQNWINQSMEYYSQALEEDPNFALAHIGLADCYIMLSGQRLISMQEAEEKARPEIMRALEIDNSLAQAHNAFAELKYQYEYDWTGAEKEFKTAVELNPNVAWIRQAYGWFLMSMGRFDEATAEMEKAQELDPSSLTVNVGIGRLYYFSRQYDQAIRQFQNLVAIEPNDGTLYFALYEAYQQKQMYPEAVDAFVKSLNGGQMQTTDEFRESYNVSGWEGFLRKQLEGLEEKAESKKINPLTIANLYARLGEKDKAFIWLEQSFEMRNPSMLQFKVKPEYDSLRDDPRYAELLRRINLQP